MKWFQLKARTRISLGLICMLLSVLSAAMMLGLVPERRSAIREGRAHLCETIALVSSQHIAQNDMRRLDQLLQSIVDRNDDVVSAGVRRSSGDLISDFGNHQASWRLTKSDRSTDTQVRVPIHRGKKRWGTVELQFCKLDQQTWIAGLSDPWMLMTAFVCLASFVLFELYLKKMLAHLDPSKTVPKRVRKALDSLAEGLLVLDRHGRIVLANQSFAEWVNQDADKLLGKPAEQFGWNLEQLESTPWEDAIENECIVAGAMVELHRNDGTTRTLIANASPVVGHEGKCRGVMVSFDDVTQLEETKRDLSVAKREADDANQAKSQFLARMSHEIRTPMNAILGYTDVLRRGFDTSTKDRQEYLDTIHGSGEHLLALINDILDLSKVESGQMELEKGPCSPYKIVKEVTALLKSKADEKGISLKFKNEGRLPREFQGDAVRLRQAVMNLAGNAIKFTDQGGVTITTRVDHKASRKRRDKNLVLAIDVADTGIGISQEAQEKVFQPFAQADTSITRRFGGTGLGLAISKQLAEAMGGDISLQSRLGKGTTFTIRIAIGKADELEMIDPATDVATQQDDTKLQGQVQQLPPCKILVADDGAANRKLIQLVLGKAGAEVTAVENGKLAVESATAESFDVILMDMQMPVMDGYTATRTLRDAGVDIPIYALTANAMQGDQEKCFDAGCSGFLSKPIKIDLLLQRLAEELTAQENADSTDTAAEIVADNSCVIAPDEPIESATAYETDKQSGVDSQAPVRCSYALDDPDFMDIAKEFAEMLPERLASIQRLLLENEFAALSGEAHWLKGVSGSAGFAQFVEPSCQLQRAANAEEVPTCDALIGQLQSLAARIDLGIATDAASICESNDQQDAPAEPNQGESTVSPECEVLQAGQPVNHHFESTNQPPIESTLPMDDPDFREIVIDFVDRLSGKLDEMDRAIDEQRWDDVAKLAHWLRGGSGTVGFEQFSTPTLAIEHLAGQCDGDSVRLVMGDIHSIANRIRIPVH